MPALLDALQTTFGYSSFRPLQREIIETYLDGRDVLAILPTGGGKSLCFQLPALVRPGLTLVVSPLIALMKDQVDQLEAAGVPATFLNSSLEPDEYRRRMRLLHEGHYRLLYAAPERLVLDDWRENLKSWNVEALAIDEAHCVSEWGHDFRPEYRQLLHLRQLFPNAPVMALTATATERVRTDIARHLGLRQPQNFIASFNRPNLFYRVAAKDNPLQQLQDFLKPRPDDAGIVYCATRASTESLANGLEAAGITARPYHAGLDADLRTRNQDLFLRDEVRVICATIAFGMGINKPNVRWVVHHDLPRHIEGYYQETGRAGRDGLPADCLLLFNRGDAAKQSYFIDQIEDPQEQAAARQKLNQMTRYAESSSCRRQALLAYFGEQFRPLPCPACDNCLEPRDTFDATLPAQKLLSCVYRIKEKSGFSVGLNHIVEVLHGADTERIRKWSHHQLTTYGIGKDLDRKQWLALGRELLSFGYLAVDGGKFPTLDLTDFGLTCLRSRQTIRLPRPIAPPSRSEKSSSSSSTSSPRTSAPRAGSIECDEALFERLRTLRRQLADARGVPAYVILGDVSLRQMARDYPTTPEALSQITGIGARKLADFGHQFAAEVAAHLESHPRLSFKS